jgi:RNA polymerase sigma factor (sigma-70 family)
MIKHIQIDSVEMDSNESIMCECNLLLMDCYKKIKLKVRRYKYTTFRKELFKLMNATNSSSVIINGITIDIEKIVALRNIEESIICSFTSMVYKQARYYYYSNKHGYGTYLDVDDFVAYGFVGLLEAIYHYKKEVKINGEIKKVKFSTYAHRCVDRHIITNINRKKNNYPWTLKMRKLYAKYENARSSFNGPANFQELSDYMKLTLKEEKILLATLAKMENGFEDINCSILMPNEILESDEKNYISTLQLTELESEVIENYLSGHVGWKNQLAKKHNITRQAVFECLRRLTSRLKRADAIQRFKKECGTGKNPDINKFIGPEPKENKEKLKNWTSLYNSLLSIKLELERDVA